MSDLLTHYNYDAFVPEKMVRVTALTVRCRT